MDLNNDIVIDFLNDHQNLSIDGYDVDVENLTIYDLRVEEVYGNELSIDLLCKHKYQETKGWSTLDVKVSLFDLIKHMYKRIQ